MNTFIGELEQICQQLIPMMPKMDILLDDGLNVLESKGKGLLGLWGRLYDY